MDAEEKREVYEVTRRAVRDELYQLIYDFVTAAVGAGLVVTGAIGIVGRIVSGAVLTPTMAGSVVVTLAGAVVLLVAWDWDHRLRRYFGHGGSTR